MRLTCWVFQQANFACILHVKIISFYILTTSFPYKMKKKSRNIQKYFKKHPKKGLPVYLSALNAGRPSLMFIFPLFVHFSSFFFFWCKKMRKFLKKYFFQQMACKASLHWSKYTTLTQMALNSIHRRNNNCLWQVFFCKLLLFLLLVFIVKWAISFSKSNFISS